MARKPRVLTEAEQLTRIVEWYQRHDQDTEPPRMWTEYFAWLLERVVNSQSAAGPPARGEGMTDTQQPWAYLEPDPAPDAPVSDNPSGLYCPACRGCGGGMVHCAWPEYCGGMRRMKPREVEG